MIYGGPRISVRVLGFSYDSDLSSGKFLKNPIITILFISVRIGVGYGSSNTYFRNSLS